MKLNVQMIILGEGDQKYCKALEKLKKKFEKQLAVFIRFDEPLAHLIEAGSDMFLMPSRYEPCGLNQLYSLKYGAVPIVRKTGGLADTIVDFIENPVKGNGFHFVPYNSQALVNTIKNAIQVYEDPKTWQKLMKRGMRLNFSWTVSSEKYIKLYNKLENVKRKK
jgi:starch synthase